MPHCKEHLSQALTIIVASSPLPFDAVDALNLIQTVGQFVHRHMVHSAQMMVGRNRGRE